VYDLTIFKLRCGWFTLKIYTKGERVLRVETIAHNVKKLPCGCSLQKFPEVVAQLQGILERFMDALGCMDQCFLSDTTLEQLPAPSQVGKTKVGGIDFNRPRIRWVVEAVLSLASFPGGFTASQLAQQVRTVGQQSESEYGPRHAAYDLKKLRGKQMVEHVGKTRRYQPMLNGLRVMAALLVLRDKVVRPILAAAQPLRPNRGTQNSTPIDRHYETMRLAMQEIFHELGIAT
jgi:hypothetical protein